MNAIELLKADHEKVRGLLSQLADTTKRAEKTRTELLEKIRLELDVHTQIEEEIFYPAFKDAVGEGKDEATVFEALEEHRAAGELVLPDLLATDVTSDKFSGRAKVLKELVEHHAKEEEDEMFKTARQVLTREQLDELGTQMAQRKKELLEMGADQIELMKKQQGQVGSEQSPPRASLQ
ncbi:hemerythrin domain-containing protein [Lysobacter sp. TY2-98]|uniref:hemerythrin domain-containing protein n=1 Tax=Lysobacter sp. TY2-98 TaxID=2290922 RepID=UPI000E20B005|nr:hemerythrin domain-containing protein [Lysobacter sp. TY2-98]AXK73151.1 hemerythrin domain-containing protein [Lysobacter sp. TY2-98]